MRANRSEGGAWHRSRMGDRVSVPLWLYCHTSGGSESVLLREKLNSSAFPGPGVAVLWPHRVGMEGTQVMQGGGQGPGGRPLGEGDGANGKVPIGSWGNKECWAEGWESPILSLASSLSDR